MRKILVVGFVPYKENEKLGEAYPDVIWFFAREIINANEPKGVVELVKMMDGVMFMNKDRYDRLAYEIACVMTNTPIYERDAFQTAKEEDKNA